MKIFVSWSKTTSHNVALALRDWLQAVIQQVEPFVSSEDISKGARGRTVITRELEGTGQGIVCITQENLHEPWLNFEAGALSKEAGNSSVRTLLFDLTPSDVVGPLSDFQHTDLNDKEDMLKFIKSVNSSCDKPLSDANLERSFDRNWPDLANALKSAKQSGPANGSDAEIGQRSSNDLLAEILDRVRFIERQLVSSRKNDSESEISLDQLRRKELIEMQRGRVLDDILKGQKSNSKDRIEQVVSGDNAREGDLVDHVVQRQYKELTKDGRTRFAHPKFGLGTILGLTRVAGTGRLEVAMLFDNQDSDPITVPVDTLLNPRTN